MMKKIGTVGVDAGMIWIGDPCYILHHTPPKDIGEDWMGFCNRIMNAPNPNAVQFNYDLGHPGLGVCVGSGYGDGEYNVFADVSEDGRVREVKVVFIDIDDEDHD